MNLSILSVEFDSDSESKTANAAAGMYSLPFYTCTSMPFDSYIWHSMSVNDDNKNLVQLNYLSFLAYSVSAILHAITYI